jgi:hypothetical protein
MSRANDEQGEANGNVNGVPGKTKMSKTGDTKSSHWKGRGETPIERIFYEVVGREMNSEEREILLKPKATQAKSVA